MPAVSSASSSALLDRVDRGLEVHDQAAPDAARLGEADADDVEAAAVHHLADDRGHLRGADVESDQIALFACHAPSSTTHVARHPSVPPTPHRLRRYDRRARGAYNAPCTARR